MHISGGGHAADPYAKFDRDQLTAQITNATLKDIVLRIDDINNIDFWLEIVLTRNDVMRMLAQMNGIPANEATYSNWKCPTCIETATTSVHDIKRVGPPMCCYCDRVMEEIT